MKPDSGAAGPDAPPGLIPQRQLFQCVLWLLPVPAIQAVAQSIVQMQCTEWRPLQRTVRSSWQWPLSVASGLSLLLLHGDRCAHLSLRVSLPVLWDFVSCFILSAFYSLGSYKHQPQSTLLCEHLPC